MYICFLNVDSHLNIHRAKMRKCDVCDDMDPRDRDDEYQACQSAHKCTSCTTLQSLENQLLLARTNLDNLLAQRREVKAMVNSHHPSILDRMPLEVITLIFQFCIADEDFLSAKRREKYTLLALGSICQSWRRIAWSTPHLWNSFKMALPYKPSTTRAALAVEWIERSGNLPLSIKLYQRGAWSSSMDTDYLHTLIQTINLQSHRWKIVDLELTPQLLSLFSNSHGLSDLQALNMRALEVSEEFDLQMQIFGVSPAEIKLERIHWRSVAGVGLKNVIRCAAGLFAANEALYLLSEASQMTHLIMTVSPFPDSNFPRNIVTHSFLESLELDLVDEASDFFATISLPALTHFKLRLGQLEIHGVAHNLGSFFDRSKCPLRRLEIENGYLTGEDLVIVARSIPATLTHLTLTRYFEWESLLDPLFSALASRATDTNNNPPSQSPQLLPSLKHFIMIIHGIEMPAWNLFPNLWDNRPLKTVDISMNIDTSHDMPLIDAATIAELDRFMETGDLTIQLMYDDPNPVDLIEHSRLDAV